MPAKDIFHDIVKEALIRDGWRITHDPLEIKWLDQPMEIDLGAEQVVGAERNNCKIAVEVKSFVGASPITDFYGALGQYLVYRRALQDLEPTRQMYLAVPIRTYRRLFIQRPVGQVFVEERTLAILVFDDATKEVVQWLPNPLTEI